ncbi:MAG: HEPN domain-containing protein [Pseudomonadota bacterium]|nr:HEPN domain-containing protein [Pseudomonadota bacterium]
MTFLTKEWLKAAKDDLSTIEHLLCEEHLTTIVSFHAQQVIEKCFKAVLEETSQKVQKVHDIRKLHKELEQYFPLGNQEINVLLKINELYIDSRYPGDLGLLPNGKPSLDDARVFYEFARKIYLYTSKTWG